MLTLFEKTLHALQEQIDAIDPAADMAAHSRQVLALSPPSAIPVPPSVLELEEDGALALKRRVAPGVQHVEKCIKNLRALCQAFSALAAAEEVRLSASWWNPEGGRPLSIFPAISSFLFSVLWAPATLGSPPALPLGKRLDHSDPALTPSPLPLSPLLPLFPSFPP